MANTANYAWPIVAASDYADTEFTPKVADFQVAVDAAIYSLNTGKQAAATRLADIVATGITLAMFATSVADNDSALAANSSTRVPTQAAVKAYADGLFAANDALLYKGAIDASANPNYPAASAGHLYRISVAGKIGGASGVNVEVGDTITCLVDGTAAGNQATVGANWNIVQANLDGAVIGPSSSVAGRIATFSGTSGKVIQDSGYTLDQSLATTNSPTFAGMTFTTGNPLINRHGYYDVNDGTYRAAFGLGSNVGFVGTVSNHDFRFLRNNTEVGRFTTSGLEVGGSLVMTRGAAETVAGAKIFTASMQIAPNGAGTTAALLHLRNSDQSNLRIRFENTGAGGRTWEITGGRHGSDNQGLGFYDVTAGANRMWLDSNGYLNFAGTGTQIGARAIFRGNNEIYGFGVAYSSTTGVMYMGASNSASPDIIFSSSGGAEIARISYAGNFSALGASHTFGGGNATTNAAVKVNGSDNGASGIDFQANGGNRFGIGRNYSGAVGGNDFHIYNYGLGAFALTILHSANVATFHGDVRANGVGTPYGIGVRFNPSAGMVFFGATNSATPDAYISRNDGVTVAKFRQDLACLLSNDALVIETNGMYPGVDNTKFCGFSSLRWSVVYAGTGSINTSDMREKTAFQPVNDNEADFARDVFATAGWYQWLDAVAIKGKAARVHFGVGAQLVEAAAKKHGLDARRLALFCEDEITELVPDAEREAFQKDKRNAGKTLPMHRPVMDADGKPKTRKGLRPDQLTMLGVAALFREAERLAARVTELESKLAA